MFLFCPSVILQCPSWFVLFLSIPNLFVCLHVCSVIAPLCALTMQTCARREKVRYVQWKEDFWSACSLRRERNERESKKYLVRRSKKDTDSKQARKHLFCSCFLEERIMKIVCLLFKTDIYWRTQFWLKFFHPGFVVFVVVSHHVIKKPNENRYDVQQNEKQKKKKSPPECITSKHLYLLNK